MLNILWNVVATEQFNPQYAARFDGKCAMVIVLILPNALGRVAVLSAQRSWPIKHPFSLPSGISMVFCGAHTASSVP